MTQPVRHLASGILAVWVSVGWVGAAQPAPRDPGAQALSHIHGRIPDLGLRPGADFEVLKIRESRGRQYVRLRQTHRGIPVFASQVVVGVDPSGASDLMSADLVTVAGLDRVPTQPAISADEARTAAVAWVESAVAASRPEAPNPPHLEIFVPEVLDAQGPTRLVWVVEARDPARPGASNRVLVNAQDGTIVRTFPLSYSGLSRRIYDSANTSSLNLNLVRSEGDPPSSIPDANSCYDDLGDTYVWYGLRHGRDAIDGLGGTIYSNVRYCAPLSQCPWSNAMWSNGRTFFGEGWAVDDIVGHEYTHGVTENESGLIYENASGAINESLSDIFGEIVDLTNGHGLDGPDGRWLVGEELPLFTLRSMSDPPLYNQPDRLHSPLYFPPSAIPNDQNDQGGVHTNSGVSNKLAYLLADGGTFNGRTVAALGLGPVADLFYHANIAILTPASGWADLFHALRQSALDLGWSGLDRANLDQACMAVEIAIFHVNNSSPACANPTGHPLCASSRGPFATVGSAMLSIPPGATVSIAAGTYPEALLLNKAARLEVSAGGPVRIGP